MTFQDGAGLRKYRLAIEAIAARYACSDGHVQPRHSGRASKLKPIGISASSSL
jgi:hypothetical protein